MSAMKDNNMNSGELEAGMEEEEFSARRFMLDDLQLAAELGKTLLERNKELETALRHHQNVIEDQTQEIEYLTKQTVALREVNDSRLRIYEQLEISIQDLERANHRLALDHTADKKHIKSLCANIEVLEVKSEELQRAVDDLTAQLDMCKRKAERQLESKLSQDRLTASSPIAETPVKSDRANLQLSPTKTSSPISANSECVRQVEPTVEQEEMLRLNDEVRENKIAFAQEHRRVTELEEQLASMVQENNRLQSQLRDLHNTNDEPKSMHEEFSFLEEVRQGQLCIRCLRGANDRAADDMSSCMDDDDRSNISSMLLPPPPPTVAPPAPNKPSPHHIQDEKELWAHKQISSNDNPYRDLVEKYEALLEVQMSQPNNRKSKPSPAANTSAPLSLQDELHTSGDYSAFSVKDTDDESAHGETKAPPKPNPEGRRKKFTQTPDFSEAETSSSGFSDETSNKSTQTERERPGSFLCTIADGEDYRFSIYDDGTSVDNRFRNRPEYRELFKEIFTILKKAAENKDEGEKLPLLDDSAPPALHVPPVTPATEDAPGNFTDDTQSVMSSVMSEQSIPFSDVVIPEPAVPTAVNEKELADLKAEQKVSKAKAPTPIPITVSRPTKQDRDNEEHNAGDKIKVRTKTSAETNDTPQRVLTPLVRQPLEYIAASTHLRKKSSSKHRNRKHSTERSGADSPVIPSPPKVTYQKSGRKRRDYRPLESSPLAKIAPTPANLTEAADWNGSTMQFYNRSIGSPTPSVTSATGGTSARSGRVYQSWNPDTDSWNMKQCTASQEINKLRRLELSYAEVLRNADKAKPVRQARRKHQ